MDIPHKHHKRHKEAPFPGAWTQKKEGGVPEDPVLYIARVSELPVRHIYHFGHLVPREGVKKNGEPLTPNQWSLKFVVEKVREGEGYFLSLHRRDSVTKEHSLIFSVKADEVSSAIISQHIRECYVCDSE